MKNKRILIIRILTFPILLLCLQLVVLIIFPNLTERVSAAQVLTNPSFTGGTTGWTLSSTSYSSYYYSDSVGSLQYRITGPTCLVGTAKQSIPVTINSGSTGTLSYDYQLGCQYVGNLGSNNAWNRNLLSDLISKFWFISSAASTYTQVRFSILNPGEPDRPFNWTPLSTESVNTYLCSPPSSPSNLSFISSGSIDISSYLTDTGTYKIKAEFSGSTTSSDYGAYGNIDNLSLNISHASGPWGVTYTKNISAAGNITSPTTNPIAVNNASTSPTPTVTTNSGYTFNNYSITSGTCSGTFTASTGVCSSVTQDITIQANWTAATNTAPTITVTPYELTASTATAPTNQGSAVTFRTTATDTADSYYLVICSTNSVTAGSGGGVPTCGGTRYCYSSATSSGSQASCSYTTTSGNAWSNAWYAFVCDNNTSSLCSTANQGSGDSGSPFYVNHPPSFTASAVSAAINPGGSISWTTTSSDPDGQRVRLYVCKTPFFSSSSCTGGSWCESGMTLFYSNPTCTYQTNSPYPDGSYNAYPYIVDSFNLASTGTAQGVNKPFTINNVAPTISSVELNSGLAISLTEGSTTAVTTKFLCSDENGCRNQTNTADEFSVSLNLMRSGISWLSCRSVEDANNNNCYPLITCTPSTCLTIPTIGGSGGTGSKSYTCTASLQYYADSTDASSLYPSETWRAAAEAFDDDGQGTVGYDYVELNSLLGGNTTPTTLNFGSLAIGQSNDPLDKTLTTTPTGNVGMDILIKANTASLCTDYPTCSTTGKTPIPSSAIKYALVSSTAYASGTAVSTTNAEAELNVPKQTSSTPPSKSTWWGIAIPAGTLPGVYNGLNVITYTLGETVDW